MPKEGKKGFLDDPSEAESSFNRRFRDQSAPVETNGADVLDADLEAAIVRAVTLGAVDVARVLASQLEERKRATIAADAQEALEGWLEAHLAGGPADKGKLRRYDLEGGRASPPIALDDEAGAKAYAASLASQVRVVGNTGNGSPLETVEGYAARWRDDREGRVKSLRSDRARMLPSCSPCGARRRARESSSSSLAQVNMARKLRVYLRRAGVMRPELHKPTSTRAPLSWHDLRATGLTWLAVRGDDPLKIKQRAGHTTFQTTEGYIREAGAVREGFGDLFPPREQTS